MTENLHLAIFSRLAVVRRSKKQTCVALSTAEAEYMALASAGQEAVWVRLLTSELCGSSMEEIIVYKDSQLFRWQKILNFMDVLNTSK